MRYISLIVTIFISSLAVGQAPKKSRFPSDPPAQPAQTGLSVRIKDIANVRGVRSNQLVGLGLVVGLDGTGDGKGPSSQELSNLLRSLDVTMNPADLKLKNIAAVVVTAELPPFMTPGAKIDVTVSSLGDAKSLQGGTLIQTPLLGADRKIYAVAQGAVSVGGFSAGTKANGVQKNHVLVGRIPDGALIEKEVSMEFSKDNSITIDLRRPDFTTATRVTAAIRNKYPQLNAFSSSAGSIKITLPPNADPISIVSDVQSLMVLTDQAAKIVVNERTGVVIIGGNIKIKPVIVAQGGIKIEVKTDYNVSQPAPLSNGATVVTPSTNVTATEQKANISVMGGTATIDQLVKSLQSLGVSPQDLIAILQALKDQGALEAELEIQ